MTDKLLDDLKLALGDAYTIERELAGGGMSRVFVAKEHALGREVVIKVLPPDLAAGVNRERFRREVQLAARLSHPYIVPLLHAGEHGELLWFTMPFITGESLKHTIATKGALPVAEVVRLLHDVVEGLAYAHAHGVIHRDIKPANILTDGHHALVTDFGVAKALSAALPAVGPAGHTTSGMAIGTPAYMAPEQLAADPSADHRVDLYAVGLLAYELLSGESPFSAPSPTATMTAQLTRIPKPLHTLRSDVPPAFSELVQRLLAKSPDERPADARTVLAELDKISGALAADVHRGGSGGTALPAASPWPLVLGALAVILLVGGGIWYSQRTAKAPSTPGKDTVVKYVRGNDTSDVSSLPLPATKQLTHADSLRIAEALRDELTQIAPSRTVQRVVIDTTLGAKFTALADSVVRVQLTEMAKRLSAARGGGDFRGFAPPAAPAAPTTPGTMAPNVPSTAPHRVVIVTQPPRPGSNPTLAALTDSAANELASLLSRRGVWTVTRADLSMGLTRTLMDSIYLNQDVSVSVAVRATNDSAYLRILLRNLSSNSFGFHYLDSDPVAQPSNMQPFHGTIRDAWRYLEDLRRLPPGQPWPQDQGRGGGPNAGEMPRINVYRGPDPSRSGIDTFRVRHFTGRGNPDST